MSGVRCPIPSSILLQLQPGCFPPRNFTELARPFYRGKRSHHASPTAGRLTPSPTSSSRKSTVDPDSLEGTLAAHRLANRERRVRRVGVSVGLHPGTIRIPLSRENAPAQREETTKERRNEVRSAVRTRDEAPPASGERGGLVRFHGSRPARLPSYIRNPKRPAAKRVEKSVLQCPWLDHLEQPGIDARSQLSEEVKAFETYMSQIPQEEGAAQEVTDDIISILGEADLPRPEVVGSRLTGLAMRHSTIDLQLPDPDPDTDTPQSSANHRQKRARETIILDRAARRLRGSGRFSTVTDGYGDQLVKAVHTKTGLNIQLQSGTPQHLSLEYIRTYHAEFPTLRLLFITLRMILENRTLFGTAHHSLTPYTLLIMIVASLRLAHGKFPRNDLPAQLMHVLAFYKNMDCTRQGVAAEPPRLFWKRGHVKESQRYVDRDSAHYRGQVSIGKRSFNLHGSIFCVQDPTNYMRDLGVACFRTAAVQETFGAVHRELESAMLAWDGAGDGEDAGKDGRSLLRYALGADYDYLERLRDKVILGAGS